MSTEDADALRAEIQATRGELGETAEALAAKADVKGRAKATAKEASGQAKDTAVHAKDAVRQRFAEVPEMVGKHPVPPVVVGLLGAAAIAVAIYKSRRDSA
jgi:Protein of unknown function (DUF3618)